MNRKELEFLNYSVGFLTGRLRYGHLSFERFESYIFDEADQSSPLDGEPVLVEVKGQIDVIVHFAITASPLFYTIAGWDEDRIKKLFYEFGRLVAKGNITPTVIAVLTNTPLETLEDNFKESLRRRS